MDPQLVLQTPLTSTSKPPEPKTTASSMLSRLRFVSIGLASLILLLMVQFGWMNALVVGGMMCFVRGATRRLLATSAVLLFTVAFPPFSLPTYWFCVAPLIWIWRCSDCSEGTHVNGVPELLRVQLQGSPITRCIVEAIAIGFAMAWLSTGFVRAAIPVHGWLVHAVACFVFSLQFIGIALATRLSRDKPLIVAASLITIAAVAGEVFEAWIGLSWSVTSLSLPLAATPIAQWSAWLTPFGIVGLLWFVNVLAMSVFRFGAFHAPYGRSVWLRWSEPIGAILVVAIAWFGGMAIEARVPDSPIRFSAMLVQPHIKGDEQTAWRPWLELDRLTQASLVQEDSVDLIVWPESSWSDSPLHPPNGNTNAPTPSIQNRLAVADVASTLLPLYQTNMLAGVVLWERTMETKYGLQVPKTRRYNCGVLVSRSGEIMHHEKQVLVPLKEGLPAWLDTEWIRGRVLPFFKLDVSLTASDRYRLLSFRDQSNHKRTVVVSICYESFLPWLPQYQSSQPQSSDSVDAVIHLVYDGVWHEHPEVIERQVLACRLRAIETRRWNLVCSTWSGSAIIDPAGRIVVKLPAEAGVLRTDVSFNGKPKATARRKG